MHCTSGLGRVLPSLSVSLFTAMIGGFDAAATTSYTDVIGTNVSFKSIQETSSFGQPEPLFDQPIGAGNSLLFFPSGFAAHAEILAFDRIGSELQLEISGNGPLDTITDVSITEFGHAILGGTGLATIAEASMSGSLTVTETTSGPIAPVRIDWVGGFTPSAVFHAPDDNGLTPWSGSVEIDVTAFVANATKATLAYENVLTANRTFGDQAFIQKEGVEDGPGVIITVIPEPGTVALLGGGLLGLAWRRQRHVTAH